MLSRDTKYLSHSLLYEMNTSVSAAGDGINEREIQTANFGSSGLSVLGVLESVRCRAASIPGALPSDEVSKSRSSRFGASPRGLTHGAQWHDPETDPASQGKGRPGMPYGPAMALGSVLTVALSSMALPRAYPPCHWAQSEKPRGFGGWPPRHGAGRCAVNWQESTLNPDEPFFSSPLDEEYFWRALRYVERNPVRARLVRKPWRYPWSSAAAHVSGRDGTGLLDLASWAEAAGPATDWSQWLTQPEDDAVVARLRRWTLRGCPLGSDSFVSKLERVVGRRLRPLPIGRPRKTKKKLPKKI